MHDNFKKVKNVDRHNADLERLYNKRSLLRTKTDDVSKAELVAVDNELSEKCSEVIYGKIMSEVQGMKDSEDGGFNPGKLWKFKKNLSLKANEPPSAMLISVDKLLQS